MTRRAERLDVRDRAIRDREARVFSGNPRPWDGGVLAQLRRGAPALLPVVLRIEGVPRTKKNSGGLQWIRGRGGKKVPAYLPSEAYVAYERGAVPSLVAAWGRGPIVVGVNARALIYRDVREDAQGDANNYYEAIADILEEAGVVANDRLVRTWDGSRLRFDPDHPRVDVELVPIGEDGEPAWSARGAVAVA